MRCCRTGSFMEDLPSPGSLRQSPMCLSAHRWRPRTAGSSTGADQRRAARDRQPQRPNDSSAWPPPPASTPSPSGSRRATPTGDHRWQPTALEVRCGDRWRVRSPTPRSGPSGYSIPARHPPPALIKEHQIPRHTRYSDDQCSYSVQIVRLGRYWTTFVAAISDLRDIGLRPPQPATGSGPSLRTNTSIARRGSRLSAPVEKCAAVSGRKVSRLRVRVCLTVGVDGRQ
jgi:hypothetical protein